MRILILPKIVVPVLIATPPEFIYKNLQVEFNALRQG